MTGADTERRALDLCEEVLLLPEGQRDAFVRQACADDERLLDAVGSMLAAIADADGFLDAQATPESPQVELTGRRIGRYTLRETLGRGGMGAVYLAEREGAGFEQKVAVKLMHGHVMTSELRQRFDAERRILATLHHPYIAALIDGGATEDGIPYLVMEYIDGVPIDEYCDRHALSVRQRVTLIQKVALAVDAAHRNLIVHRDLKPSNVLVTRDGIPKLLDFGIAKLIAPHSETSVDHTLMFGHVAITPDYASPEQILENTVTTVSDVYSLGVLSYELLSGVRPYHVKTGSHRALIKALDGLTVSKPSTRIERAAERERIVQSRSTTAASLARTLRGDLDNILLKALQRDPARRYQSVANFSDDLGNYLAGLPVAARADSIAYRSAKFLQRNWLATGAASLVLLSLTAGLVASQQQRDIARQEAARASKVTEFLQDVLMAPSAVSGAPINSAQNASVADLINLAEQRVAPAFPGQPDIQAQLYSTLAQANRGLGRWDKALELSDKALALLDGVREQSAVQALVRVNDAVLRVHAPGGDIRAIRPMLVEAERYAARSPGVPSKVHATALAVLGQTEPSSKEMARLLHAAGAEWLAAGGSEQDDLLATVHYKLGQLKAGEGRFDEAEADLDIAIGIFTGDGTRKLMDLGFAHETMGFIKTRRGDYVSARAHVTKALDVLAEADSRNPWLLIVHLRMSELERVQGNIDGAQRAMDTAFQLGRDLALAVQTPHWTLLANEQAEIDLARGNFQQVIDRLTARLDETTPTEVMIPHRVKARYLVALAHAGLHEFEAANATGNEAFRDFVAYYGQSQSAQALRTRLEAAGIVVAP